MSSASRTAKLSCWYSLNRSANSMENRFGVSRVVGKMLRFYTLGRADEAAIDEVLAVEEYVFPFDGADVLQQREVHAC